MVAETVEGCKAFMGDRVAQLETLQPHIYPGAVPMARKCLEDSN